jgi:CBS domain-containing protein
VHRLLVMDDTTLFGLVSTSDIMQAVAEGRLASTGRP